jgi:transketolase
MTDPSPLIVDAPSPPLDDRSKILRRMVVQALDGGGRGHIGSSMSLIEMLRVLYDDVLAFRVDEPTWEERDRLILSKGHGCLALYAILADKGFFPADEMNDFCRASSFLGGHPEWGKVPGVEASTGALGHGLSIAVGMALAARMRGQKHKVVAVTGDGEINEGSIWEAAMSAGKHRLDNLTVMVDYNKIQSYGFTDEVQPLEPLVDKWRAFGFGAIDTDGHNIAALRALLTRLPLEAGKPTAIVCHTVKGKGIPFAEHEPTWHHKSNLPAEDIAALYAALETA